MKNKFNVGDRILWLGPNFKGTVSSIVTSGMFLVILDKDLKEENIIPIPFYEPTNREIKNITYEEDFEDLINK